MKNNKISNAIIIGILFLLLNCSPSTDTSGSFFEVPENVFSDTIPEIPNEPGFYVNGENKGVLLFTDIVDWINNNVKNGTIYGIVLHQNISINPVTFSYPGKNVCIIIKGNTEGRSISLAKQGSLFTIGEGVTFGLSSNIELKGISDNNRSLIRVSYKGKFIMENGIISGNSASFASGLGVGVNSGGTFIMNGGKIIDNTLVAGNSGYGGGGVSVSGTFIMNGGEISNNTFSTSSGTGSVGYGGGGVYLEGLGGANFTMNGGIITNNKSLGGQGGGIFLGGFAFTMNDGEISNNTTTNDGGGIYRFGGNTDVIIQGGSIFGNSAGRRGGGVYCSINNNSSQYKFIKKSTGGIIYGNNADVNLQNIADQNGHAVFINDTKKRNTTVTEYVELDSSKLSEWE